MLDEDTDSLVSFYDFITPLMSTLPNEVAAMFTQDQRYRQESFNDLRIAFDQESRIHEGQTVGNIAAIRARVGKSSRKELGRQFENMLQLLKVQDTEVEISQADFLVGLARLEKRALLTFVSKIYQAEERRHRQPEERQEDRLVRDTLLKSAAEVAVKDPELSLDQAKKLIQQLSNKVEDLETRLQDFEDTSQLFSPEELPQAQADETNIWARFNAAVPKFMDVVINTSTPLKDAQFLEMANSVDKKLIEQLEEELGEARKYKNRFDAMVDELSISSKAQQEQMAPNTINCINKNLVVQNNIKKKTIAKLKRKITVIENENKVYKEFSQGKITK